MMPLKFAYLTACLVFLVLWAFIYRNRSDLRKTMIDMSLIGGIASLAMAYFWTSDWWRPQTLTSTRIGVEDFLLGFSNGGIASVVYLAFFNKGFHKYTGHNFIRSLILFSVVSFVIFGTMHDLLNFSSFTSWIISATSYSAALVFVRRDLLKPCLINGLLMVLVAAPVYYFSKVISPEALKTFYVFPLQPDIRLYGVPIQDFIFYYAFGFMMPLVYEYWHGLKLKRVQS